MSSADSPMWRRIAWSAFLSFGLLCALVDAGVLVVTIRHHTAEYHEVLSVVSNDLAKEYAELGGDAEKMAKVMREDTETHGTDNLFLLISDGEGKVVAAASSSADVQKKMLERAVGGGSHTYRIRRRCPRAGDRANAPIRVRRSRLPDGNVLSVGCDVTDAERHVFLVAALLGASLVFALFVGAAVGVFLAHRFSSPLSRMAAAAKRLADGDYSARVALTSEGREISELENAFNQMASENEKTLRDLRTLTDDIAHDLRTPLTRMRAAAEMEASAASASAPSKLAVIVSEESSKMLEMINTMLDISQTSNLPERSPRSDVDLAAFAVRVVDLYSALAEESSLSIAAEIPPEPVVVSANEGRMQQLLGNLLDNAIKFSPSGGKIRVAVAAHPPSLSVCNSGPGIAPEDQPHVFKRFWRAEKSRSLPGNGLGLALVQAIATAYGATVECESSLEGPTMFKVVFPQAGTRKST